MPRSLALAPSIIEAFGRERFSPQSGGFMSKQLIRVFFLLSALSLSSPPALGQARSSSADLTGTVLSPSKSVIQGATITATNLAIGLTRAVTTDAAGNYRIPLLPPGQYEVKVEVTGYNTQIKKGINLTVGQIAVINLVINFEMILGVSGESRRSTPMNTYQRYFINFELFLIFLLTILFYSFKDYLSY
jgi:Carboxypeptidase regulatory-like domain